MSLPLSDLKILDFSTLLPGPYATMLMADMGAEILKVESPDKPDMIHTLAPMFKSEQRKTSYANLTLNRNKRSIALDLKQPKSIEVVRKLVGEYDIVIEQFRPGVMDKLGLGYQALKAINPELIYCSITGYGQTGVAKDKAGHDINYMALSGLASYSGTQKSGPVLSATQIADIAGGSHQAVMSVLAAVIARQKTGEGQHLDISMTDSAFSLNAMFGAGAVGAGVAPELGQTLLNGGCFYDYYETADGRYLSVGGLEPKFATEFFTLIGYPEWLEMCAQPDQQLQLKQNIANVIISHDLTYWQNKFAHADACVEPVLTVTEAARTELFEQRNMLAKVNVDGEVVEQISAPVKFSSDTPIEYQAAPIIGQHSFDVLESLGYTQQQVSEILKHD